MVSRGHDKHRRGSGLKTVTTGADLCRRMADLIASIKPHALCDSCMALDVHVSYAEAHEAALSALMGEMFERTVLRCDRCNRLVDATRAREHAETQPPG